MANVNPLLARMRLLAANKQAIVGLGAVIGRVGVKGLVAVARAYLGPLADRASPQVEREAMLVTAEGAPAGSTTTRIAGLDSRELAILGLATTKLAYELGELALHNPSLDPDGKQPVFELDERGRGPAMSIAHVFAAVRWWQDRSDASAAKAPARRLEGAPAATSPSAGAPRARLYAARSEYYGTAPRFAYAASAPKRADHAYSTTRAAAALSRNHLATSSASTGVSMTNSSSRGCGTCGGSHAPAPQPVPTYVQPVPHAPEKCGGCGGACGGGCGARSRTYESETCPTFAISCETKAALRDCAKTALCDFLRCVTDTLCPDGKFDSDLFDAEKNPQLGKNLIDCVGQLACSFMHCVPDALCPPPCEPAMTPTGDRVPCGYAVEVVR